MTSFYLKLGAGLLLVLAIFGGGWKVGSGHWHSKYDSLVAEDWKVKAVGERIARVAIEAQLADARRIAQTNAQVIQDVQTDTAALAADRDRLRRLLASATRPRPDTHRVPETGDQSPIAPVTGASGDGRLVDAAERAINECRRNSILHAALIAQLKPQL